MGMMPIIFMAHPFPRRLFLEYVQSRLVSGWGRVWMPNGRLESFWQHLQIYPRSFRKAAVRDSQAVLA